MIMKKLFINIHTFREMFGQMKRLLNKKRRVQCMGLFLGMIISSFMEMLGVGAIIPFALILFSPEELMQSEIIKKIGDIGLYSTYEQLVLLIGVAIVLIYFLKNVLVLLYQYLQGKFRSALQQEMTNLVFKSYMNRPYSFFLNVNTSELIRGVREDISGVSATLDGFCGLFAELLTCIMIGLFILCMDPVLALALIGVAVLIAGGIVLGFKRRTSYIGEKFRDASGESYNVTFQALQGYKEIIVTDKRDFFIKKNEEVNKKSFKLCTSYIFIQKMPGRVIETAFIASLLSVAIVRVLQGGDTSSFVALLSAIGVAAIRILPSITNITNHMSTLIYNRIALNAAHENVMSILGEKCDVDGRSEKSEPVPAANGIISVHNLNFRYGNTEKEILKEVCFEIEKGDSIGIIGESGAGKSTLLDVILGLLIPQNGQVSYGGVEIEKIPRKWARLIGYVPQSVFLLDDSIRRNIAWGVEDSEISDELVWEAIREAKLETIVNELPGGLDTVVGERGVRFSGGQRQRLAIARALYHKPEILFLDEATSALDNETEAEVMKEIEHLHGKLTIIIVAHRLTTIEKCDRVFEVVDGNVILKK